MRRILVVLVIMLAGGLLVTSPAQAGNWEETLLDPTPARIEPGVTYTFGYWILQHGSYPYMGGDLGPTALVAKDQNGDAVEFPGTATKTAGHYSAEVVFPHRGTWSIASKHEILMTDPLVATVTVPGSVRIAPSQLRDRAPYEWGAIKPSFPPTAPDAELAGPGVAVDPGEEPTVTRPAVVPRSQATVDKPAKSLPWTLVTLGGLVTIGFAVWLGRHHAKVNAAKAHTAKANAGGGRPGAG